MYEDSRVVKRERRERRDLLYFKECVICIYRSVSRQEDKSAHNKLNIVEQRNER